MVIRAGIHRIVFCQNLEILGDIGGHTGNNNHIVITTRRIHFQAICVGTSTSGLSTLNHNSIIDPHLIQTGMAWKKSYILGPFVPVQTFVIQRGLDALMIEIVYPFLGIL